MIRVGFVFPFSDYGWLGGLNYYRNLLSALHALPDRKVEPVLLVADRADPKIVAGFPPIEYAVCPGLRTTGTAWIARRCAAKVLGRDVTLQRIARERAIAVFSHQGFLGRVSSARLLGWIPDFQERHLPQLFSVADRRARARRTGMFCRVCDLIVLSSSDAQNDLAAIDPVCARRSRVLRFVADVPPVSRMPTLAELQARHGFAEPYFHLPNQFWAHKNHRLVIRALAELRRSGRRALVLCTGNLADHRQPGYFTSLLQHAAQLGVADLFRPLGTLPYGDLMGLMSHSLAVINPSRFEGWSTTVEEAKSLGKLVLLSDLRVHREQAPARAVYFSPDSHEELAMHMQHALLHYDRDDEARWQATAAETLTARRLEFARAYEQVIGEIAGEVGCADIGPASFKAHL